MEALMLRDCQTRLLKIAKEFDKICRRHGINYYMVAGTLLGAIRHKGFIPWDDDMDFGVPIEKYEVLVQILEKELPLPYRVCRYWNTIGCVTEFAKIEDTTTCIDDPRLSINLDQQIGLNIDVFPLNRCNKDNDDVKRLQRLLYWKHKVYTESSSKKKYKHYLKKALRLLCPLSLKQFQDEIYKLMLSINGGDTLTNLFGIYGDKEFMPIDYYGKPVEYQFEDITLLGPVNSHAYLSQLYGEYKIIPPENKRHSHLNVVYLR